MKLLIKIGSLYRGLEFGDTYFETVESGTDEIPDNSTLEGVEKMLKKEGFRIYDIGYSKNGIYACVY